MVRILDIGVRHWIKHGVAKGLPVTLEIDVLPAGRTVAAVSSRCRLGPVGWLVAAIFGIAVHAFNRMRVSQRHKGRERRRLLRVVQDRVLLRRRNAGEFQPAQHGDAAGIDLLEAGQIAIGVALAGDPVVGADDGDLCPIAIALGRLRRAENANAPSHTLVVCQDQRASHAVRQPLAVEGIAVAERAAGEDEGLLAREGAEQEINIIRHTGYPCARRRRTIWIGIGRDEAIDECFESFVVLRVLEEPWARTFMPWCGPALVP